MKPDFSGYATKAGLKCSDGRTIMPEAFKHMDGMTVPLVWQHGHSNPENVLGHAVLEARKDGIYARGFFNGTTQAKTAKELVQHKDIKAMSIWANQLVEKSKQVFHGVIREVSLVLSGANPGALIDFVAIEHADGSTDVSSDEAIIYTGLELQHGDADPDEANKEGNEDGNKEGNEDGTEDKNKEGNDDGNNEAAHAATDETVQKIYDSLSDEQKKVVHFMIGAALEAAGNGAQHSDKEGNDAMSRTNVFEQNGKGKETERHELSHEDVKGIVADAMERGSLKDAVKAYAMQHGIENIDILFPDARTLTDAPEWVKRQTEWVAGVLSGTRHTPFSRIKTRSADLTFEDARAKGYIKGNLKKEEFFGVSQRVTTPTTISKKQKLDRDDMIDITDFDVVAWLKGEMRIMLEEELARAVLIGDGRDVASEDKVKDPVGAPEGAGIRSILHDHDLYITHVNVPMPPAGTPGGDYNDVVEAIMRAKRHYKGTGAPTFYTAIGVATEMLLSKDGFGRRRWNTIQELASSLGVSNIVEVEVFDDEPDLLGIMVNLQDYALGADRGGDISMFDDFDIDYNQYKYLIETRCSGALTKVKSALVVHRQETTDVLVDPVPAPTYDPATNEITIPTNANVDYFADGDPVADGATVPVPDGTVVTITAAPTAGHYFTTDKEWSFHNPTGA